MLFSRAMAVEDTVPVHVFDSIVVSVCCCSCSTALAWFPTGGHWQLSRLEMSEECFDFARESVGQAIRNGRMEEMRAPGQGRGKEEEEGKTNKPIKTNGKVDTRKASAAAGDGG